MVLQGARSMLAVQLAKGTRSGRQQTTGQWAKESINAAKLGPSPPPGWSDDLSTAVDKWAAAAKRVTADSVDGFVTLTDTLKSALANARAGIDNAPKGTGAPRAAVRTLDGLTEAVAEQLDALANQLGAAGAARLAPAARTLRFTIGGAPTATRPFSKYWSTSKSTALKALPASERTVLNSWFDAGFSTALDDWAAQVAKLPGGDHDKLLARSWTIANTLNRYRVGILRLVSDPAARAPLFDAIDALATAVSSALRQSDEDE